MILPIVLDLCLWLAPQLSVEPLAKAVVASMLLSSGATIPQTYESLEAVRQLLLQFGQEANLFGLLSSGIFGVPSLVGGGMPDGTVNVAGRMVVSSPILALALAVMLSLVGIVIAAFYLTTVASVVRGETLPFAGIITKAKRNWLRLLMLALTILVALVAVSVPLTLSVSVVSLVSPTVAAFLASLLGLFGLWVGLWILFYLFFVVDAMMLQEVGLQRAIINSIIVVRSSFWSAIGLIILLNVLTAGLSVIWRWLAAAIPAGLVLAIVGNAFIGSGLVSASFVFYRDRYEAWRNRMLQQKGGA
ncbi:MAG: hypothetical protein ACUVWR_06480 [Anaerolineae bacterium]